MNEQINKTVTELAWKEALLVSLLGNIQRISSKVTELEGVLLSSDDLDE